MLVTFGDCGWRDEVEEGGRHRAELVEEVRQTFMLNSQENKVAAV